MEFKFSDKLIERVSAEEGQAILVHLQASGGCVKCFTPTARFVEARVAEALEQKGLLSFSTEAGTVLVDGNCLPEENAILSFELDSSKPQEELRLSWG